VLIINVFKLIKNIFFLIDNNKKMSNCEIGYTNCGGGTCVDLNTDTEHCGTCNNTCDINEYCCGCMGCRNHDNDNMLTCGCLMEECLEGYGCCTIAIGVEPRCVELKTDDNNCGTCNNQCLEGDICCGGNCCVPMKCDIENGICYEGRFCVNDLSCSVGEMCCNGQCININNNNNNCGTCDNVCPEYNYCINGVCICCPCECIPCVEDNDCLPPYNVCINGYCE